MALVVIGVLVTRGCAKYLLIGFNQCLPIKTNISRMDGPLNTIHCSSFNYHSPSMYVRCRAIGHFGPYFYVVINPKLLPTATAIARSLNGQKD